MRDQLTGLQLQVKRPEEFIPVTFRFSTFHPGETIHHINQVLQTVRGVVHNSNNLAVSNLIHDGGNEGQAWISGGTDGEYYVLTLLVTTSIGAVRSCSGVLYVKAAGNV